MKAGPALAVRNLVKRFGDVAAVDDVSFHAPAGAFVSLLGPSGSGKTTLLRLIAGLETPDGGSIEIEGQDVAAVPPYERDIGVVFQKYALFPHMTVAENLVFPLRQRRVPRAERDERVREMLATVGLSDLEARYPAQLSGGQQQRVALARALIFRPRILVMDEPLAALDRRLREHLQREIRALQQALGITTVYVTHDQTEAFVMSDLVAVMHQGRLEQLDTPRALYEAPQSELVARFLGDSNIFEGHPIDEHEGLRGLELSNGEILRFAGSLRSVGARTAVLVRPEKIRIETLDTGAHAAPAPDDTLRAMAPHAEAATASLPRHASNLLEGRLESLQFRGESIDYRVAAAGQEVLVRASNDGTITALRTGETVRLSWAIADTVPL